MEPLRIAMVGQRGVPATFGGVEHHVEEIGARLAERGHSVVAFTRPRYASQALGASHRGIEIARVPTIHSKHLDAIVHSSLSTLAALARRVDVVHYHALGPGIPAAVPRYLSGARVVQTVHGLDADRQKWGVGARAALRGAEWLSARVPDATVVVSRDLERHYLERHGRPTWFIPNGVDAPRPVETTGALRRLGVERRRYLLFVGRLVPEKAPDMLLRAFAALETDDRLVIAGGSSFTDAFETSVERMAAADPRVVMAGYVFGRELQELYSNAEAFVLPSTLEGMPLTLLEAASHGVPIVASDIAPHVEILGASAPGRRLFATGSQDSLLRTLRTVLDGPDAERAGAGAVRARVLDRYSWDDAALATESVYEAALGADRAARSALIP